MTKPQVREKFLIRVYEANAEGCRQMSTSSTPARRRERERKYGLEAGDYERLSDANGGACWICDRPESVPGRSLAIDHDHQTGAVRGLLCTRCNQVLGRMADDADLLRKAAAYLDQARASFSDGCRPCMGAGLEDWITAPGGIAETDGGWTRFWYEHHCGAKWTCGWNTSGLPLTYGL